MGVAVTGSSTTRQSIPNTVRTQSSVITSAGGPGRHDPPLAHGDQVVGVAGREVEVVQHHHDGGAAGLVEVGEQVEHLDLVGDVEVRRRLVEQQQVGLLGQGHRDPDPLALAARELVDEPVGEVEGVGELERLGDRLLVLGRPPPERALVRVAATPDQVDDADPLGCDRVLRQQPQGPRRPAATAAWRSPGRRAAPAPEVGRSSRAIPRSRVDLPQALAPTMTVVRPSGTSVDRSVTTVRSPYPSVTSRVTSRLALVAAFVSVCPSGPPRGASGGQEPQQEGGAEGTGHDADRVVHVWDEVRRDVVGRRPRSSRRPGRRRPTWSGRRSARGRSDRPGRRRRRSGRPRRRRARPAATATSSRARSAAA